MQRFVKIGRVCVCVCVCVCVSSASVYDVRANLPDRSLLNSEGLENGDIAKKLSFSSYSLFLVSHCQTGGQLQLSELMTAVSESDDHYLKYINLRFAHSSTIRR